MYRTRNIATCAFFIFSVLQVAAQKPNFVIILTDDQGYADLYANLPDNLKADPGYDVIKATTPNMDALAHSGVIFTDAHTNGNTCAPTRVGIMIGRYPQRNGFWDTSDSRLGMKTDEVTLAQVLQQGGYTTGMFGKWHMGSRYGTQPLQRGFDYFYGFLGHGGHDYYDLRPGDNLVAQENMYHNLQVIDQGTDGYMTDFIGDSTVAFIERNKSRPFFAHVCFTAVHSGNQDQKMQAPPTGPYAMDSPGSKRDSLIAMLGSLDDNVQKIMDALNDNGLRENTVVVFLSDNGGATDTDADNSPLEGKKHSAWEGGNRVPFFVTWPGTLKAGKKFDEMVMSFDIFPTFVHLAGLQMPDNGKVYDGVNFWPWLEKETEAPTSSGPIHEYLIFDQNEKENYDWGTPIQTFTWDNTNTDIDMGMRMGDWKLRVEKGNVSLFHLGNDIGETDNVIGSNNSVFEEMKGIYNEWHSQMPPQEEAQRGEISGCLDPRYEEYEDDITQVTRHSDTKCETLIEKTGCRDHKADNFDYTVTNHVENQCEYTPIGTREVELEKALSGWMEINSSGISIHRDGPHRIQIFDISGSEIWNASANQKDNYSFRSSLKSGVYFLKIMLDGKFIEIQKLIL